jgi:CBS domain-containing protein
MEIREIMTENPICCVADTNLEEVARMMIENDCGAIPVVEDQEKWKPMGIVTDRDIVVRAVAEGKNPLEMTAEGVMSQGPISVRQDASVEECEREMESHQVRRILVVDKSGSCVGIVSLGDIALHCGGQETAEVVGEVSRPSSPDR